ncbi:hypothetical protein GCM10023324_45470 [Streptomyces youssoufiensis]
MCTQLLGSQNDMATIRLVPLAAPTTVRVDPEAMTQGEWEARFCSTAWGPCRCPRHRGVAADG